MLIASIVGVTLSIATKASAATLSNMWAVETNMDASGSGQLWIAFKANAADTAGSWTIALSGTGAAVAATQTVTTTGCTSTFSFSDWRDSSAGYTYSQWVRVNYNHIKCWRSYFRHLLLCGLYR